MNISQIFPQCVLVAITSVEGGAGNGGAGIRARCEWRFPFGSITITLWGMETGPMLPEQKPWRVEAELALLPLSAYILTPNGNSSGVRGGVGTQRGSGHSLAVAVQLESETHTASTHCLSKHQWCLPPPCSWRYHFRSELPLSLTADLSLQPLLPSSWSGTVPQGTGAYVRSWHKSGQELRGSSQRKRPGLFLVCCVCKQL